MTSRDISTSINIDAVRATFLGMLARQVNQGAITKDQAAELLRNYDSGALPLTMNDLPLEPGEIVAPSIRELIERIQGE